jgi:hypothetical protein
MHAKCTGRQGIENHRLASFFHAHAHSVRGYV